MARLRDDKGGLGVELEIPIFGSWKRENVGALKPSRAKALLRTWTVLNPAARGWFIDNVSPHLNPIFTLLLLP